MALPDEPITRNEHYLAAIAGQEVELPDPITREDQYLDYIARNGGGGGTAADTTYDNSTSGLEADNVQDAVDELSEQKVNKQQSVSDAGKVLGIDNDGMVTPVTAGGGGSDISLGIVGATAGQSVEILTVDENGKPTSWKAKNGDVWEKIVEVEYDEETGGNPWTQSVDSNGNPFRLKKFAAGFVLTALAEGATTTEGKFRAYYSSEYGSFYWSTDVKKVNFGSGIFGDARLIACGQSQYANEQWYVLHNPDICFVNSDEYDAWCQLEYYNINGGGIGTGCRMILYGVRE